MAIKRSAPQIHPSRREQVPSEPQAKRRKPNNPAPKAFQPTTHPINQLKAKARSLRRLLEKNDDLPADVRVEKERALQTVQYDLERNEQAKKRNDMIGRYHKIRFFDRQKAIKRLKKVKKEYEACDSADRGQKTELRRRVADAEVNVNYAISYPLDKPYVSLYPRRKEGENEDSQDGEHKGDMEMWLKVKQCMVDGTLDALRSGRLDRTKTMSKSKNETLQPVQISTKRKQEHQGSKAEQGKNENDDDDSDGGFFE